MKVVELANALTVVSKIYEDAGNLRIANGIISFTKLLHGHEGKTVTAFANELKKTTLARSDPA